MVGGGRSDPCDVMSTGSIRARKLERKLLTGRYFEDGNGKLRIKRRQLAGE